MLWEEGRPVAHGSKADGLWNVNVILIASPSAGWLTGRNKKKSFHLYTVGYMGIHGGRQVRKVPMHRQWRT